MVASKQKNVCRFCSKVFCCFNCRNAHENSKHSKPKCLLCIKSDLPFNPCREEEEQKESQLLCHLVFNHMPLYCKLCGKIYKTYQDFLNTKPCSWWDKENARKQLHQTPKLNVIHTPSNTQKNREKNEIFMNNVSPLTTQLLSSDKKLLINTIDNSAISHLKSGNFDSPPDLIRKTSTPVHSLITSGQKQSNTAFIPQFTLKTPSSSDKKSFETTGSNTGSIGGTVNSPSEFESQYFTGQSICFGQSLGKLNNFSISNNQDNTREKQSWHSPAYSAEKKQQESMNENINDEYKEKSIIRTDTLERISRINESTEKRVRFSDQCKVPDSLKAMNKIEELTTANSACFVEKEIFFEARENFEDTKETCDDNHRDKNEAEVCCCHSDNHVIVKEKKSPTSSNSNYLNNNNNVDTIKKCEADSNVNDDKESSSSRVLMMLLVEKTGSKDFSDINLGSLIDSGLKKLEKNVSSCSSIKQKENLGPCAENLKTFSVEVLESYNKRNGSMMNNNSAGKDYEDRTSIKESFSECYDSGTKTPLNESQEVKEKQHLVEKANSFDSYKSDGFFALVSRVVRCALKKLPAVGSIASRNLSREPLPHHACSPVITGTTITSTSSLSISSTDVLTIGSTCTSTTSQILLERSANKRPRERLDSSEEPPHVPAHDSAGSDSGSKCEVIFSPAAKRHRGWYRIKAREPIARMRERQIVSPRGASLETQRFQQGTLMIGDTMLPLPSRAHQSTQTED